METIGTVGDLIKALQDYPEDALISAMSEGHEFALTTVNELHNQHDIIVISLSEV